VSIQFVRQLTMCSVFSPKYFAWTAVVAFLAVRCASDQQSDDLQEQLQELKQQYEQTTKDLQQRIAGLEQQIERQNAEAAQAKEAAKKQDEATVSAVQLAAESAVKKVLFGKSKDVGANFQGKVPSQPTYDLLQEAENKLDDLQQVGDAGGNCRPHWPSPRLHFAGDLLSVHCVLCAERLEAEQ
jgi:hypothetical protein